MRDCQVAFVACPLTSAVPKTSFHVLSGVLLSSFCVSAAAIGLKLLVCLGEDLRGLATDRTNEVPLLCTRSRDDESTSGRILSCQLTLFL